MKANKKIVKTIISNTVMFISVLLFVSLFKMIFGDENASMGVSTIVLGLALLSRDLAKKPFKNFAFLLGFNLITVIGAYVFQTSLWLGLVANLLIMGSIGYLFTYEISSPFNMLFGLQYVLLIGSPIVSEQLVSRLISAVVSAGLIIALQLLVNKNKLSKLSKKFILEIEESILLKINLIKENKCIDNINDNINKLINKFKLLIFESGQIDFKMNSYANISIDILSCIEKINTLLDYVNDHHLKEEILSEIYIQFENVKNEKFDSHNINNILCKYVDDLVIMNGFLSTFEILQYKIKEFKKIIASNEDDLSKDIHIPEEFKIINGHKINFKNISYRVAYGIRLGILFALTGFITTAFNLEFGKWMMFTVFALTQPYAEFTTLKTKKRIFGTVLGAIVAFILLATIKGEIGRTIMILIVGYLMSYVDEYKYKVILITISSICVDAANYTSDNYVVLSRVIFVGIGVVIALLANKFLLRREYKHAENTLVNMQKGLSNRMIEEVILSKNTNINSIRNIFVLPALIEERVNSLGLSIEKEFITKNKELINDLYQIHLFENKNYKDLIKTANSIVKKYDIKVAKLKLKEYAEERDDIRENALILSIISLLNSENYITKKENLILGI